jgi:hypothetical protein
VKKDGDEGGGRRYSARPRPSTADIERRHDGFSSTTDICFILLTQANASIRRAGGMEKNAGRAGGSHHSSFLLLG